MATSAGHAADQVLGHSFMDTVRNNPLPAALIGIGTAWLLVNGRSKSDNGRHQVPTGAPRDWRTPATTIRDGSSEGAVGTTGAGAQGAAEAIRDTAERTGRRARVSFERVIRESPLALGAAAAIVGAAVGMSMPRSEAEDGLMGDARDTVVDRARSLASDAATKVTDAVGAVKDTTSRSADRT